MRASDDRTCPCDPSCAERAAASIIIATIARLQSRRVARWGDGAIQGAFGSWALPGWLRGNSGDLPVRVQFRSYEVDSERRLLLRDARKVHLTPKAFDLLVLLIQEAPRVLRKDELHERLWQGTFVSD